MNHEQEIRSLRRELDELKSDLYKLKNAIIRLPDIGDWVQRNLWF